MADINSWAFEFFTPTADLTAKHFGKEVRFVHDFRDKNVRWTCCTAGKGVDSRVYVVKLNQRKAEQDSYLELLAIRPNDAAETGGATGNPDDFYTIEQVDAGSGQNYELLWTSDTHNELLMPMQFSGYGLGVWAGMSHLSVAAGYDHNTKRLQGIAAGELGLRYFCYLGSNELAWTNINTDLSGGSNALIAYKALGAGLEPSGALVASWAEIRDYTTQTKIRIYIRRTEDLGTTWVDLV